MPINVYSKSEHELGRLLPNFAHTPFTGHGSNPRTYASVEGWWYFHCTGKLHPYLCSLYGSRAKSEGKKYERVTFVDRELLKKVYLRKLECNPYIREMLLSYNGEFDHYYVFNGQRGEAKEWLWTAKLWEEIRDELLLGKVF